jgi:hypothetical protein
MRNELERVRAWANDRMSDDTLPGWAWYEVAKLRSDIDSVLNRVGPLVFEGNPKDDRDTSLQIAAE